MRIHLKKPLAAAVAVTALSAAMVQAEVVGKVEVASSYLFRGLDKGSPQVSGSVDYVSSRGLYVGVWASNTSLGADADIENNYYLGFSGGDKLEFDLGLIQYRYPNASADDAGTAAIPAVTYNSEVYLILGTDAVGFEVWAGVGDWHMEGADNVSDKDIYYAITLGGRESFTIPIDFVFGYNDVDTATTQVAQVPGATVVGDYGFVDIGYKVTDNLELVASQVLDAPGTDMDDLKLVVSYRIKL